MAFPNALAANIAGIFNARHASGSLIVGGIDLLAGLASQSITAFAYTDNTSDQADDLSIEIADPQRTWMQTWLPKKGVECFATIKVNNWNLPGDTRVVDCGVFWLDQIDFRGPPNTVSVRAVSVPVTTGLKTQKYVRSWEGVSLKDIAAQIASESGLVLVWDTKEDPKFERVDQLSASLEFIRDKAKEHALSVKIYKRQLIMYSEKEYEEKPAVYVITYAMSNILSFAFSSKLNETYKSAENSYYDPATGELYEDEFEPEEPPEGTGSTLKRNERVESEENGGGAGGAQRADSSLPGWSPSEAAKQAANETKNKANLREKNKHEKEASFVVVGNPDYLSGLNVELLGFGNFDGKWFISSTLHSISGSGYTTELKLRYALKGY